MPTREVQSGRATCGREPARSPPPHDTISGEYSYRSGPRMGPGANPEQLIAAAHASCFSMALSNILAAGRHPA